MLESNKYFGKEKAQNKIQGIKCGGEKAVGYKIIQYGTDSVTKNVLFGQRLERSAEVSQAGIRVRVFQQKCPVCVISCKGEERGSKGKYGGRLLSSYGSFRAMEDLAFRSLLNFEQRSVMIYPMGI